jgi:magnesium-transporting ATPase (P-type)
MKQEGIGHRRGWHSMTVEEVERVLQAGRGGLSSIEAEKRLSRFGFNRLSPPKRRSMLVLFLLQFNNLLIYVLLVSALLTSVFGHFLDAAVILAVVLLNAAIGLVQEGKAQKAIESIRELLSPKAAVMRDGVRQSLEAEVLVPGDVVFIESGDKVPADIRLFYAKNLRIAEAALTGESVPTPKSPQPVKRSATLGDRTCMAFSGTIVTSGQGAGLVVETGDRTQIGRISTIVAGTEAPTTRLLVKMGQFGRILTAGIGMVSAVTFLFGVFFRGYSIDEMFLAAVGLAVAAIPEGLPAILTITLAIGVRRMAARNAIIRKLPSVETLGSVTVICSDKTGTLTRNEMTVKTVATASHLFELTGTGYDPKGTVILGDEEMSCYFTGDRRASCSAFPELEECARAGLLCNDAHLKEEKGRWEISGDPTEGALVVMAVKVGLDQEGERRRFRRIDTVPFESENRFMATLHHSGDQRKIIYVKGAPEKIGPMCSNQRRGVEDVPFDSSYWSGVVRDMAQRAERPLALAMKYASAEHIADKDVTSGLTMLAMVGIIDPPRGSAITAIRKCKSAGIKVKMITGDHVLTARAIGKQMGIGDGTTAVTGEELDLIKDDKLVETVKEVDVFARVSPEHKLRLVAALQANGEVVAMTGDGVNDAPALKRADIGVAMGLKGTEAAKEASVMVLADDNFASIEQAVEEGRTIYDNLKKAIIFILPTNAGEAFVIMAAILLGRTLPITPIQILWINMITAVTLALSLSFEPAEADVMKRPPRDPREPIFSPFVIWRTFFVGIILLAGAFGLFHFEKAAGQDIQYARTVAVNTLVFFEVFYLFNTRCLKDSILRTEALFGNAYALAAAGVVVLLQMLLTYLRPLSELFGTVAIDLVSWTRIILAAFSVLFLVEMEKAILRIRS